jgi:hypothetical protein
VAFGPRQEQYAIVQPYDPEGIRSPAEVDAAKAINHVTAYQRPADRDFGYLPPVHRTAHGPVVGVGIVKELRQHPGHYKIYEAPYGTASGLYNNSLQQIAALPLEQRSQAAQALEQRLYDLHDQQAIGYDVTAAAIVDALARLDTAVQNGQDLTAMMRSLQLPQYRPPQVATI